MKMKKMIMAAAILGGGCFYARRRRIMKYWYMFGLFALWASMGSFISCERKEPAKTGRVDSESGSFLLYTYDDAGNQGDSSITLDRKTIRNEKGEEETVWALSGKVTTKYAYGYAGAVLIPDDNSLARLQSGAETVKLRINGDEKRYRFSVDTENVTDGNNFGMEITAPRRAETVSIPLAGLKQEPGWGVKVPFDRTLIKNLKIQTIGQPVQSFQFTIHGVEIP
jgi:hypothetical protein